MSLKYIEEKEFKEKISQTRYASVTFTADWCAPCGVMKPNVDQLEEEFRENKAIDFFVVDIDKNQTLAQEMEISSIPTTILFKDGQIATLQRGVVAKKHLMEQFHQLGFE